MFILDLHMYLDYSNKGNGGFGDTKEDIIEWRVLRIPWYFINFGMMTKQNLCFFATSFYHNWLVNY